MSRYDTSLLVLVFHVRRLLTCPGCLLVLVLGVGSSKLPSKFRFSQSRDHATIILRRPTAPQTFEVAYY